MRCPACQKEVRKYGKGRKGNQRYECVSCRKTFTFSDVTAKERRPAVAPSLQVPSPTTLLPRPEPHPPWPGPSSGVPEHLWDLRAVYRQEKACDSTPAQRVLRQALEENVARFMQMLNDAEESHAKNLRRGIAGEGEEEVDMGTGEALELVEKLIKEFEEEEEENLAKREIGASLQESLTGSLEREKQLGERLKELERNGSGKVGGDPARAAGHPDIACEAL